MPEGFLYYIWEGSFYISRSKEFFNNKKGNYEMRKLIKSLNELSEILYYLDEKFNYKKIEEWRNAIKDAISIIERANNENK